MTSLACVPVGRTMLSCVALLAVPLLALAEPWKPMITAPGQVSARSHSFAAARHTVPALPAACWQPVLVPLHWSVVQGLPSSVQVAPALPAGCWQALLVPSHWSRVQGLVSGVQAVVADTLPSAGQVMLDPSQVSATSHTPATAGQTAPALPAGCWQVVLVPLHWSRVQGLPSSVQVAPALPAGCWQVGEPTVPLHTSVVQGLPSSVQTVPADFTASAGHVALEPVQVSARSHSFTALRQTFELGWKVQLFLQQEEPLPFIALPRSQSSPESRTPLPQGFASANVVSAVRPEEPPVAVSVNVTPMSKTSTLKSVFVKSPFSSANAVSWRSGSNSGSSCRIRTTVSLGSQPEPVMTTFSPGA